MEMSLRLFTRAPWTRIRSWLSSKRASVDRGSVLLTIFTTSHRPRNCDLRLPVKAAWNSWKSSAVIRSVWVNASIAMALE